ncbi:hypothetical protein PFISCL1PPCAC_19382 [Pristionchus fissidentatus]|uniref:Uncharacterized protein n=1 Tax=Pristionchus fissidentatus TaxID=1538716 RepID=A0AAV5W8M9_9BILA|nr:hypothetical protein PFISCL1PPCAC_19382 [Pristionchus fissidentatus]
MISRAILLLSISFSVSVALKCLQCDRNEGWFDQEMNKKRTEICNLGLMEPTLCTNKTHTHCIVDSFRSGENARVVTSRKCGTAADETGCTMYNTKTTGDDQKRKLRHLITTDGSSKKPARRTIASYVEVCSLSCPEGACINSSSSLSLALLLILTIYRTL